MKEKFYAEDDYSLQNEELAKTVKNNDYINMLSNCNSVVGNANEKKQKNDR